MPQKRAMFKITQTKRMVLWVLLTRTVDLKCIYLPKGSLAEKLMLLLWYMERDTIYKYCNHILYSNNDTRRERESDNDMQGHTIDVLRSSINFITQSPKTMQPLPTKKKLTKSQMFLLEHFRSVSNFERVSYRSSRNFGSSHPWSQFPRLQASHHRLRRQCHVSQKSRGQTPCRSHHSPKHGKPARGFTSWIVMGFWLWFP